MAVGQRGLAVVGLQDPGEKNTEGNANGFPQNALKTFQMVSSLSIIPRCSCKPRNGRDSI